MTLSRTLTTLVVALALGACTSTGPEPEEAPMPEGPTNGSFTAPLNGFQIHYEVHGQGPVLMTLPNSWGLSLEALRAMYEPLEDRLTMVYFDPRGMGGSEAVREDPDMGMAAVRADFQALREHLDLETVNAIGWSNGAINLIWLAYEHPETLSAAIFLHGMASFSEEDMAAIAEAHPGMMATYTEFMEAVSNPELSVEEQTALQRTMWMEKYFPLLFADPETAQGHLANILGKAELSWPHAAYSDQESATFDGRDLLPEIPVRSLVIAGAHDMLPPERAKPLADGLPNAEWVVFENSGHFAPVEETELFKSVVFDFLGVGEAPASEGS
jgi:pimeloyl-ACP methyl ester carboxylesterase